MSLPELRVSMPEQSLSKPEHAGVKPTHHNVGPILAFCVLGNSFLTEFCHGNRFLLPRRASAGADFGGVGSGVRRKVIASEKSTNSSIYMIKLRKRPAMHMHSVQWHHYMGGFLLARFLSE